MIENPHNDGFIISDLINGYLITKRYIGYTKQQSIKMFKEEFLK